MLLDVWNPAEQTVPSDGAGCRIGVRADRPPDEQRGAHDVVFRHETPVTAVGAVVAVVAHHPVIVHLEGVFRRFLSVDEYLAVANLEVVLLIDADWTLVDGNVVDGEVN